MERHPKVFPATYTSLVRAGESGGVIEDVLWRIVAFGEQEEELRGKAVGALIYPCFLMVVGGIAIFILVSFVFPKLMGVFEDFQASLPWPTVVVMAFCSFMGKFWWAVLIALGLGAAGIVSFARSENGRRTLDTITLSLPVVGDVVQKYEMAKFARVLGTLVDNGVPILSALKITVDTLSNTLIIEEITATRERIAEGDSLSESLHGAEHFPPMVVSMFAVGEESGRLGP